MGLIALLAYALARRFLPWSGTLGLVLHLGTAILAGMSAILPLLRWFKVEEATELSSLVVRLIGKIR
jgi:ABC-type glycerol-3-phosphate transport system permease component